ncbi:hypothetical protein Aperf_G00000103349 [Anoplocephala perfoliata]
MLESFFQQSPYPSTDEQKSITERISLSDKQANISIAKCDREFAKALIQNTADQEPSVEMDIVSEEASDLEGKLCVHGAVLKDTIANVSSSDIAHHRHNLNPIFDKVRKRKVHFLQTRRRLGFKWYNDLAVGIAPPNMDINYPNKN